MTRWLLQNGEPDLGWQDFRGKTVLEIAAEQGYTEIAALLQAGRASG